MAEMQNLQQQPGHWVFSLSDEHVNTVMYALRKFSMPFEVSAPVIMSMERQLMAQQQALRQQQQSTEVMAAGLPAEQPAEEKVETPTPTTDEPPDTTLPAKGKAKHHG